MINYVKGDILKSEARALVNPVNCVGVMGAGLALKFKEAFPENFNDYAIACSEKKVKLGKMFVFCYIDKIIINFPTKDHWKDRSFIDDIAYGLDDLCYWIISLNIKSIAIPALGCGLGGLKWSEVKELIDNRMKYVKCDIYVFEPNK